MPLPLIGAAIGGAVVGAAIVRWVRGSKAPLNLSPKMNAKASMKGGQSFTGTVLSVSDETIALALEGGATVSIGLKDLEAVEVLA
jgi:hypothetical protein